METDWNAQGLFTGQIFHIRLNQTGVAQANAMADMLKGARFTAIYCSDQVRALETVVPIAEYHEEAGFIVTDQRLREVSVGLLMGTKMDEVTDALYKTRHPQFDFRPAGGESRKQVVDRMNAGISQIKADFYNKGEVLVVGHGTSLRVFLEEAGVTEVLTRDNFVRVEL